MAGIILILLFFIFVPVVLLGMTKKKYRKLRNLLLAFPVLLFLFVFSFWLIDTGKKQQLNKRYPELKNLIFNDSPQTVYDSIQELQHLMRRFSEHEKPNISYKIDKHRYRYNQLYINNNKIEGFAEFLDGSNSIEKLIYSKMEIGLNDSALRDVAFFYDKDIDEISRFFNLIKYLDSNKINAAYYGKGTVRLTYADSLSVIDGIGERSIIADTSGFSDWSEYKILDVKDGLFLIEYEKYPHF